MTNPENGNHHRSAGAGATNVHNQTQFAHRARAVHPYIKFLDAAKYNQRSLSPVLHRAASTGAKPWNVADLCKAYDWPTGNTGAGVIAIVELGGGWRQSDVDQFFDANFPGQPGLKPSITDVSVDTTRNNPGQDANADGEVALDIQVAAAAYAVATGKAATIRLYWSQDIASAVREATSDGCDVCSISWGADEAKWGVSAAEEMEQTATDATVAGMIVFAASGDNDSSDGGPTPANVDLPASCPHVIGCGGTRKTTAAETVWNNNPGHADGQGTGGGYSTIFRPLPDWQIGAPNGPGRLVPDVAANADPYTGYNVVIAGTVTPVGGTSAVAPLYAGLFASFGTKLGWVTPELWQNEVDFNDITHGNNGSYRAKVGPDACTGLGSPIGTSLSTLLANKVASPDRRVFALRAENEQLRQALAAARAAA